MYEPPREVHQYYFVQRERLLISDQPLPWVGCLPLTSACVLREVPIPILRPPPPPPGKFCFHVDSLYSAMA